MFHKEILHVEPMTVSAAESVRRESPNIASIRVQHPALACVLQIVHQDLGHPLAQPHIFHWEHDLDPLIEIARHPVGATQVNIGVPAILEVEILLCSRNRPITLRTRIRWLKPRTPGRKAHAPRTMRSISTPACEALYNASITG